MTTSQLIQDPKKLQKALYQSKMVQFNETVVTQWGHKIKVDTIKIERGEFKSVGSQLKIYEESTDPKAIDAYNELRDAKEEYGLEDTDEIFWDFDVIFEVEPY